MTMESWTDARLNELAMDVQGNAVAISNLRATAEALLATAQLHQQSLEVSQRNFEAISSEIRGLQLENRRMFEELRSRREDEET